jgi:hypothetical protein
MAHRFGGYVVTPPDELRGQLSSAAPDLEYALAPFERRRDEGEGLAEGGGSHARPRLFRWRFFRSPSATQPRNEVSA